MISKQFLRILLGDDMGGFFRTFAGFLDSEGFNSFTVWEISGGTLCKPVAGKNGIQDGLFDIYDLGYSGDGLFVAEQPLNIGGKPVYATVFCENEGRMPMAVSFHEAQGVDRLGNVLPLATYLAAHISRLAAINNRMELLVDYQKKLDFVKESADLFKALSPSDALINALNFFYEAFNAEAACVLTRDSSFFAGLGFNKDDLEAVSVSEEPLSTYINEVSGSRYITDGLSSSKFNVNNLFFVDEPVSGALFILFNISGDVIPDKELSEIIARLVSTAVENARIHDQETAMKIEQAEMQQSVEIIKHFVQPEIRCNFAGVFPNGGLEAYCANFPARSAGGDYASIVDKGDFIFACLVDVCGKGFSAAMLTVMLATVVDSGFFTGVDGREPDIKGLADFINRYLLDKRLNSRFITGFFCVYEKDSGRLSYVSCGHEPVLLLRGGEIRELSSRNIPMGIMEEDYELIETVIEENDLLFIYSDGVTEYITEAGLKEKIAELCAQSPEEIVKALYSELVSDKDNQRDDFTCTVLKFQAPLDY